MPRANAGRSIWEAWVGANRQEAERRRRNWGG